MFPCYVNAYRNDRPVPREGVDVAKEQKTTLRPNYSSGELAGFAVLPTFAKWVVKALKPEILNRLEVSALTSQLKLQSW
jgi:hypothetical protein